MWPCVRLRRVCLVRHCSTLCRPNGGRYIQWLGLTFRCSKENQSSSRRRRCAYTLADELGMCSSDFVFVHPESREETFAAVQACHRDRRFCTALPLVLLKQHHVDVRGAIVTEERGRSRDVGAIRSRGSGRLHPLLFGPYAPEYLAVCLERRFLMHSRRQSFCCTRVVEHLGQWFSMCLHRLYLSENASVQPLPLNWWVSPFNCLHTFL